MNKMSALLLATLTGVGSSAFAGDKGMAAKIPVETYSYSTNLDIARVISLSPIPDVCGVVTEQMIYEDSKGIRHALEYQVMGNGCTSG